MWYKVLVKRFQYLNENNVVAVASRGDIINVQRRSEEKAGVAASQLLPVDPPSLNREPPPPPPAAMDIPERLRTAAERLEVEKFTRRLQGVSEDGEDEFVPEVPEPGEEVEDAQEDQEAPQEPATGLRVKMTDGREGTVVSVLSNGDVRVDIDGDEAAYRKVSRSDLVLG